MFQGGKRIKIAIYHYVINIQGQKYSPLTEIISQTAHLQCVYTAKLTVTSIQGPSGLTKYPAYRKPDKRDAHGSNAVMREISFKVRIETKRQRFLRKRNRENVSVIRSAYKQFRVYSGYISIKLAESSLKINTVQYQLTAGWAGVPVLLSSVAMVTGISLSVSLSFAPPPPPHPHRTLPSSQL